MNVIHAIDPLYALSGFMVGGLMGLTGVGGGSLMTPLLVLLFGIHPATAVGTDLLYAGLTKSGGALVHGLNRTIDWRVTLRLATGSVPAAAVALAMLAWVGTSQTANSFITSLLGFALILTAGALFFRKWISVRFEAAAGVLTARQVGLYTTLLGAILGVLVSLSSVGAGAIGVTVLVMLYPKVPIVRIVGSDIAHAVPLTLIAGAGHWSMASVDWPLLGSLLTGSLPGIAIGSQLAAYVPDRVLRPVLASTLLVVGAKLSL